MSGHTALHYLFTAGYNGSTGFSSQTGGLGPSSIYTHIIWYLEMLTWPQSIGLGVAVLASLWGVARYRRQLNYGSLWLLVVWILLTVLVLSSTGDDGSGFGLPVIAMTVIACGAILGQLLGFSIARRWTAITVVVLSAVLLVGLFAEGTGRTSFWWNGPPYRTEVLQVGGSWGTNLDVLSSQVSRIIGSEPTLDALNTAIINGNALTWTTRQGGSHLIIVPNSAGSTKDAIASLAMAKFVISGSALNQYPPPVDEQSLELAAEARNFLPVRTWTFGNDTTVILWKHTPTSTPSNDLAPHVKILKPAPGDVLSGNRFLVAHVSGRLDIPVHVEKVEFLVSGEGFHDVPVGAGTSLGVSFGYESWLGAWNTTTFPDGRYILTCVAVTDGKSGRSRGVAVQVKH